MSEALSRSDVDVRTGMIFKGLCAKKGLKGDGIVFLGKMVCFIPEGVPGRRYKFEVISVRDRFCNGRVIKDLGGDV